MRRLSNIAKKLSDKNKGFTLVELLLATLILAFVLVGLIQVFIRCSILTELTRNKTAAMSEALAKMEEIRNNNYDLILTKYNDTTFTLNQLNAIGKSGNGYIYVTQVQTGLLEIEIVITWWDTAGRGIYDRIFGEDVNKNGVLDTGAPNEDLDGNNMMSSPVTLVSLIADRIEI